MLYLDNKITGTRKCIGHDGTSDNTKGAFHWKHKSVMDQGDWILGSSYEERSIEPLMRIYGIATEPIVPDRYTRMLGYLNADDGKANTMKLLGPSYTSKTQQRLVDNATWLRNKQDDIYLGFYQETNRFLYSLQPAEINPTRWMSIERLGINLFDKPYSNGDRVMINPPRYVRDRSSTGRLSVVEGVRTTTMKSEHRNILKDAWQLDFQAMEPRFLLSLIGKTVEGDFYDWIAKEVGIEWMDRAKVKLAVLSSMYGHRNQIKEVTDVLGLRYLEKELEKDVKDGWTKNWFGRPIHVEDKKGRHLVALWLQSSAAEAALLGFMKFCDTHPSVHPHWLIHDALVYSVDPQNIDEINQDKSIIIEWNGQEISMPYTIGRIE